MRTLLLISFLITVLHSCQMDTKVQDDLTGTWQLRASLPEKLDEEITLTPEAQNETDLEATEDVNNTSEHPNDTSDFAEGLSQMSKGIEQLAQGLAEIGAGIGKGIQEAITQNLSATITLNSDSTLQFLPENSDLDIHFGQRNLRWWVEDGFFLIQKSDKDSAFKLTIVPVEGGYDLQNEKIHLHLRKPE